MRSLNGEGDIMDLMLVTRAAQTAFNKANYSRAEAEQNAMALASYLSDPENFAACCKLYQTTDETDLAYALAKTMIEDARSKSTR